LGEAPYDHELASRLDVPEERVNTMQAD